MTDDRKNQGEGNRDAAKDYNKDTREFIDEKNVEAKAEEARKAVENDDQGDLRKAEEKGKSEARK